MGEAQVFVKIDNYKDVLHTVDLIKNKLSDAKNMLAKVKELKEQEDAELGNWDVKLNEVQDRVENIDKILFEPNNNM